MLTIGLIIGVLFAGLLIYIFNPFRKPILTESDYSHHISPWWELYYISKYIHSIKRAEKGSELEAYFKGIRAPIYQSTLHNTEIINIKATGDLMKRQDLVAPASRHLWDHIGEYLFSADFVIGNLEFAVNPNRVIENIIRFSVPENYADPFLKDPQHGKFDCVAIANNHINDSLSEGIIYTCNYLDKIGVPHVGANRTPQEIDEFPIVSRKNIKIAILAYTFSTNGIPLEENFNHGTNLVRFNAINENDYDPSLIYHHIKLARKRGADIIIASNHWGVEFEYFPQSRLVRRAHDLLNAGVDIIIGNHPHILNPAEWYTTKDGRKTVCFYSLGNLISHALIHPTQKLGLIVEIAVEKGVYEQGQKITRLKSATITPTYFMVKDKGKHADHRIIQVLSSAKAIREGKRPPHINSFDAWVIKCLDRNFRKYFWQEKAFTYR